MTLDTGRVLNNRYRIVRLLGQGGFGAVYRAWDTNLSRPCALKENLDTSPVAQRQFEREAIILAGLTHPNLPRVTDHFFVPGQGQYLVMDYIEGDDSQQILQRAAGPLTEAQALGWILQICDALTYLHTRQPPVIHRDIKPANIKITPDGRAMLVDFGIAKEYDPGVKTTIGARAITSGYSPPEQYGRGITDAQSDIYALGATLYALLTGQAPADSVDIMARTAPPPRPVRQLNPAVSPQVEAAVAQALQIEKARRPRSVAEFKAALGGQTAFAGAGTPVQVYPPQAPGGDRLMQVQPGGEYASGTLAYAGGMEGAPGGTHTAARPSRSPGCVWPALVGAGATGALALVGIILWLLLRPVPGPGQPATQTAQARAEAQLTLTAPLTNTPEQASPTPNTPPTAIPASATPVPLPSDTSPPPPSHTPTRVPTNTPSLPAAVIEPYCAMFNQSPQYVKIGQPVILWWRWDASTREQVEKHMHAATYEIYLDGNPIQADQVSQIEYLSDKQYYRVSWYASVGVLSPGSHHAERYLTWDRQITDGWETFGPGGNTESESHDCEIIVQ